MRSYHLPRTCLALVLGLPALGMTPAAAQDAPAAEAPAATPEAPVAEAPVPAPVPAEAPAPPRPQPRYAGWRTAAPTVETVAAGPLPPTRFTLGLALTTRWQLDESNRLFASDRAQGGGGLSFGYRFLDWPGALSLGAEVDWVAEKSQGWWGLGRTSLASNSFGGALVARYAPRWWMRPFVRAGGGLTTARAELDTSAGALHDNVLSPFAFAGAGLGLATSTRTFASLRHPLSFWLDVEGGFTLARALDLTLGRLGPGGEDAIPGQSIALGKIGRSHPHLRVSFGVGF